MSLYNLVNVSVTFGTGEAGVTALHNINLNIEEGQKIAIVGPSGSGKSTLLNVLSGLEQISSGKLLYDNQDFRKIPDKKLAELRLTQFGFVFQDFYLISSMTVMDNICLPAVASNGQVDWDFIDDLIKQLGLEKRVSHLPGELSGGEKQRVAIARALINKPKVIFADEPSGNLDSKNGNLVFKLLFQMAEKYGQTLIYVTHDTDKAKLAQYQIKLMDGGIQN